MEEIGERKIVSSATAPWGYNRNKGGDQVESLEPSTTFQWLQQGRVMWRWHCWLLQQCSRQTGHWDRPKMGWWCARDQNDYVASWSCIIRKRSSLDFCKQRLFIVKCFTVSKKFSHLWSHSGSHSQPCALNRMGRLSLIDRWTDLVQSLNNLSKLVRKGLDLEFSLFWSNPRCSFRITLPFPSVLVPDCSEDKNTCLDSTNMLNTSRNLK